ncbi:MAG: hypothetical protein KFH87_07690 [Bacteroidetes bacterium]|nr:hypothetical protein [Bacteroidota bacterium]
MVNFICILAITLFFATKFLAGDFGGSHGEDNVSSGEVEGRAFDSTKATPGEIIRAADASTLFLVPTGYPIPAGRKLFGLYPLGTTAAFAVSERISLSLWTCVPLCLVASEDILPVAFAGKAVPVMDDQMAFSVGAYVLPATSITTIVFASGTRRLRDVNLTVGMAGSYGEDSEGSLVFSGFEFRATSSVRLMFEALYSHRASSGIHSPYSGSWSWIGGVRLHHRNVFLELGVLKNLDERQAALWIGLSLAT